MLTDLIPTTRCTSIKGLVGSFAGPEMNLTRGAKPNDWSLLRKVVLTCQSQGYRRGPDVQQCPTETPSTYLEPKTTHHKNPKPPTRAQKAILLDTCRISMPFFQLGSAEVNIGSCSGILRWPLRESLAGSPEQV